MFGSKSFGAPTGAAPAFGAPTQPATTGFGGFGAAAATAAPAFGSASPLGPITQRFLQICIFLSLLLAKRAAMFNRAS